MSVCLAGFLTSAPFAQQPPDFSGRWTLPPDAPLGPAGKPLPAPGFGAEINIVQTPTSVTISKVMGGQTIHVMHPLDGSESRSITPGRLCEGDQQSIWTASMQDGAIHTTLVGAVPPGVNTPTKMNVRTAFRLPSPDTLVVEITFQNPGMTAPQTRATTYKKAGPPATPSSAAPPSTQGTITQLAWLGGTWIGSGATGTFEERWTPPAGGSMLAVARSIRANGVMSSFEFLCIVQRNGGLVYQAMPNGRQPATDFTMTKLEGTSITFENPAHDFPKMIKYTLSTDGTLEAVVSGTEKQKPQTFRFKKQ